MGFLTDEEIQERLNHPDNLKNKLEIHKIEKGRGSAPEVPIEIKKTLAILANEGESQTSLGKAFDLSPSSIFQYENGRTSDRTPKPELQKVVKEVRAKIKDKKEDAEHVAIDKLLSTLSLLTPDKLDEVIKPKDISAIAKDLAIVSEKLSPKEAPQVGAGVHLHLYASPQKKIEDYEIIDV